MPRPCPSLVQHLQPLAPPWCCARLSIVALALLLLLLPVSHQVLYDQEKSGHESQKQAAERAADELRQEAAKRQRLEDTNKVSIRSSRRISYGRLDGF